ncbi:uncharacterized protein HGUI_01293 [Hanseniaspora guilliermondii]|uniref:Nucleotide exchange factor SIL1 n=1 Tax=Hanseniaspora guilliermondii TaxID=56406 RepID=A0A1L0CJV7_9ASCO|nr:uncharacterized protein HGUI_01293 [Hanseniaspora guilliermondii]
MNINQIYIVLLAISYTAKATVTLTPESHVLPAVVDTSDTSSDTITNKENIDWFILSDNSNLVCNKKDPANCHPIDFEPESDWKEILPLQMIPTGLDIRMNLETGLKEAKLKDLDAVNHHNNGLDTYEGDDSSVIDKQIIHEFSEIFKNLEDDVFVEDNLENLIDFSHDYKHGSKIIHNEQSFIMNQIKSKDVNDDVKDLYLRLITSCLRNNEPAKQMFFVKNVDFIVEQIPVWVNENKLKFLSRAVNILQNVAYKASSNAQLIDNLEMLYMTTENQSIKIKILEIFADLELLINKVQEDSSQINFHFDPSKKSLIKRNAENKANLESWFNEYAEKIQLESLDEFYVQKFLKTMIEFKNQDTDLKADNKFIEWLAQESMNRFKELENSNDHVLETRDLEKESFSKELIRARHEVFGNKHASRVKMPLDEL